MDGGFHPHFPFHFGCCVEWAPKLNVTTSLAFRRWPGDGLCIDTQNIYRVGIGRYNRGYRDYSNKK